jgi:hypothetical protein
MKISINICSACGREKQIHEIVNLNNANKRYCEDCYKSIYQEIHCTYCGKEMPQHDYHNHIMNMHCE